MRNSPADFWRDRPAAQQPMWPDTGELAEVTDWLGTAPPLVFAAECELLRERLAAVARGQAVLLQGGDCAESFADCGPFVTSGNHSRASADLPAHIRIP